jgi:hypothetical protein
MAQEVSCRSLIAEARVRFRVSACGACSGPIDSGIGFSPGTSVFPCQFHSTGAPLFEKMKKKTVIIFTIGCGAFVASAAGPFTKKKYNLSFEKVKTDLIRINENDVSHLNDYKMLKRK